MDSLDATQKDQLKLSRSEEHLISLGFRDPVIQAYKKDVDRTLLRENLKLTVQERFEKFQQFMKYIDGLRAAKHKSKKAG